MSKLDTIGGLPVKILQETDTKLLVVRTDTLNPVYEIFLKDNKGIRRFHKTHRDFNIIEGYFNRS